MRDRIDSGPDRRGLALVLVAGLMALLLFLSVAFARLGADWKGQADLRLTRAQGSLAAHSGMAYAWARLRQDSSSSLEADWTSANACDDWTARGDPRSAPIFRLQNPSYPRGDPWRDEPGHERDGADNDADGVCDEPREGTGVYSAGDRWRPRQEGSPVREAFTGRLRSTVGRGGRFSLRIETGASRISVNSGELGLGTDDQDLDGVLNEDDWYVDDRNGNGVADWRDPDFWGNRHLVNLLDNLGALLGVSSARAEPYDPGSPPDAPINRGFDFRASDLGHDLVCGRPRGGYASVRDLAQVLPPADFLKVEPYLGFDIERVAVPSGGNYFLDELNHRAFRLRAHGMDRFGYKGSDDVGPGSGQFRQGPHSGICEQHARIDVNRCPLEAIVANLMYVTASGTGVVSGHPGDRTVEVPGRPDPILFYDWPPGRETAPPSSESPFVRLSLADAWEAARALVWCRPLGTWQDVLKAVVDVPFEDDPFTPDFDESRQGRFFKQDLILALANANPYVPDPFAWGLNSLEVEREREGWLGFDRARARRISKFAINARILSTAPFDRWGKATLEPPGPDDPLPLPCRATTEFVLAGEERGFTIACAGWSQGWRPGEVEAPESLRDEIDPHRTQGIMFSTQFDFEPAASHPHEMRTTHRWPGGMVICDQEHVAEREGIQSWPAFFPAGENWRGEWRWTTQRGGQKAQFHPGFVGDLRLAGSALGETSVRVCSLGNGNCACRFHRCDGRHDFAEEIWRTDDRQGNAFAFRFPFTECFFPGRGPGYFMQELVGGHPFRVSGRSGQTPYKYQHWARVLYEPCHCENRSHPDRDWYDGLNWFGYRRIPFDSDQGPRRTYRPLLSPLGFYDCVWDESEHGLFGWVTGWHPVEISILWPWLHRQAVSGSQYEMTLVPFPLLREGVGGASSGEIKQGTISFWFPSRGGEDIVPGLFNARMRFVYASETASERKSECGACSAFRCDHRQGPSLYEHDYLIWEVQPDDTLWMKAGERECIWRAAGPVWTPWRHVALVFDDSASPEGETRVRVFIDGNPAQALDLEGSETGPFTVSLAGRMPFNDCIVFQIQGAPVDDVTFYPESLSAGDIGEQARDPRHVSRGRYRSSLLSFDADELPQGAEIVGAAWDAFRPKESKASLHFKVTGYADDGRTPLGEREWSWDDSGIQRILFPAIPGCRHFRWEVEMRTRGPLQRESPVLDEFRLIFQPSAGGR